MAAAGRGGVALLSGVCAFLGRDAFGTRSVAHDRKCRPHPGRRPLAPAAPPLAG